MRNLPIPKTKNKAKLSSIIDSKREPHKPRLILVKKDVKSRYDDYCIHEHNLEMISPSKISGATAKSLINCYSSQTIEMSTLRDELLDPGLEDFSECPFCGIGEPTTLDHYLPKESFPEFSVFAKNLIPICNVCNSSYKKTLWIENGERLFIHTYYDKFPDNFFFEAQIAISSKTSVKFIPKLVGAEPYFSKLFKQHFEKLALDKRYRKKAASEISRKRRSLERIYKNSGSFNQVAHELCKEAKDLEFEYPKNHWKPILYKALSKSKDFCDGGFRKQVIK